VENIKTYISYIVICILFSLSFPWWSLFIPSLATGWFLSVKKSQFLFLKGFIINGVIWLIIGLAKSSVLGFDLANRLTETFKLPSEIVFFLIPFIVSGLIGGSGMMAGGAIRRIQMKE
jgi:hypothetical protein